MNHLRSGVSLLIVVGDSHTIELSHGVVATEHARRIFPCDSRTRLHLCPRQLTVVATQVASLGDEVEHTALSIFIARIPVLHGGIFHLGIVVDDNLDDGGMELVLIAHRSRTSLKIRHIRIVVGNDERALKLSCIARIDTEITAQFHRTTYTLGDIYERTVAEHRTIECGKEIVAIRHHRTEIFLDKVGIILHGITYRTEDDALLGKFLLEGGLHRYRVHDGIHRRTAKRKSFLKRSEEHTSEL